MFRLTCIVHWPVISGVEVRQECGIKLSYVTRTEHEKSRVAILDFGLRKESGLLEILLHNSVKID